MIYPVYIYGSSILRKKSEEITPDYKGLDKLVDDMFETMYSSDGVGLAAPQIGKAIKLFVVDVTPFCDEEPELESFRHAFINATILERSEDEWLFNEGCLSLPGVREDVMRASTIKMHYFDENFKEQTKIFKGMAARVIQHEYDHIEGRVFTDNLAPLRRTLIKSKLAKLSKGEYKASYRCKQVK